VNKSEELFEKWCSQNAWIYERIQEGLERTPDYRLSICGKRIYAEVKEIVANDEEKKVISDLAEKGISDAFGAEPGKTVREKIKEGYPQIKKFSEPETCSGIPVLYNNSGMVGLGRIDHYDVLSGMFGLQTVPVSFPNDPNSEPVFGPDYLGPKKSVTPERNRYLSGILTLYEHFEKGLMAFFYHNPHATFPIETNLLKVENCIQYEVDHAKLNWKLVQNLER